jgi:hypothetical protein
MMDPYVEIARIAPMLDWLPRDENAKLFYSIWCDALFWSDEVPGVSMGDDSFMRYLLAYRTQLILGKVQADFTPYWEAAKHAFPKWPGFAENRCSPNEELAIRHQEMASKALDEFK